MNFVGNTHEKYKVPVNIEGSYKEILNTDQDVYSGKGMVKSQEQFALRKQNQMKKQNC